MASDFTKEPQAKPRVIDEDSNLPSEAPSRQAIAWVRQERQMYGADDERFWFPINPVYSTASFSNPPTDAELDAEFGNPETIGANFTAIINNGGLSTNVYYVVSTDNSWWILTMVQAV